MVQDFLTKIQKKICENPHRTGWGVPEKSKFLQLTKNAIFLIYYWDFEYLQNVIF